MSHEPKPKPFTRRVDVAPTHKPFHDRKPELWEPIGGTEDTEWHKRCIEMDEKFKERMLEVYPNLKTFVSEKPGTERLKTLPRPAEVNIRGWQL